MRKFKSYIYKNFKRALSNKTASIIRNDKGNTMLETLVAFVVVMIVLAIIYNMLSFSNNMRLEAIDIRNAEEEFEAELYKKSPDTSKISIKNYTLKENSDTGNIMPVFVMKLDEEKTNIQANFMVESGSTSGIASENRLNLMDILATGYSSNNTSVKIQPKAIKFRYEEYP
ncbi:MAG: prepilin-type N-terminal cleavage/methylation domain-containing protein [Eubacterium sp.]|nr:prepilin-type N-terminal cleavage/methylation domain-containing protein [Eubacterium sp.]